jgi:hypothetical protein
MPDLQTKFVEANGLRFAGFLPVERGSSGSGPLRAPALCSGGQMQELPFHSIDLGGERSSPMANSVSLAITSAPLSVLAAEEHPELNVCLNAGAGWRDSGAEISRRDCAGSLQLIDAERRGYAQTRRWREPESNSRSRPRQRVCRSAVQSSRHIAVGSMLERAGFEYTAYQCVLGAVPATAHGGPRPPQLSRLAPPAPRRLRGHPGTEIGEHAVADVLRDKAVEPWIRVQYRPGWLTLLSRSAEIRLLAGQFGGLVHAWSTCCRHQIRSHSRFAMMPTLASIAAAASRQMSSR